MDNQKRKQILITEYKGKLFQGIWEDGKAMELSFYDRDPHIQLGDIYLAQVKNIVPGFESAFLRLTADDTGYLPLRDAGTDLHAGDEVLVQVAKESQKTKGPAVTTQISLTGELTVLVTGRGKGKILVSEKIKDEEWKQEIRQRMDYLFDLTAESENHRADYGFIIRTAAYGARPECIVAEAASLLKKYREFSDKAATRTCCTKLYSSDPAWLTRLYKTEKEQAEILTDLSDIYDRCESLLENSNLAEYYTLRLYKDESYPLSKLYSLESVINETLNRKVWLKSGGYLVIEDTEAMTVIDVNSGKYQGKHGREENILKVNLEAAAETARQIRLRNLSGMILIDFIDMNEKSHEKELLDRLKVEVASDPVQVNVVDITGLGIVECTRNKRYRPLYEQIPV